MDNSNYILTIKEIINFIIQNTYMRIKILSLLLNHVLQNKGIKFYPLYKNFVLEISIKRRMIEESKIKVEDASLHVASRRIIDPPRFRCVTLISATNFKIE